ncbi:peptide ABC transporter substrate-binding protein [Virgibacillus necropolis]|uniref:Peptide ABC transporter substrate-binding protein n=1 Tax=Virgibacillus necropolis TaxID=163877 RepID=A0A221MGC8_9BACI|nr:peptide ABC transporter substrate-binding protein [Virgibacillus necropolis]ASN06680.1 peptide ABC transporter substrate-binding protein [Virgibacillus necropolis]
MKKRLLTKLLILMFIVGLVLTGCNFNSSEESTDTPEATKEDSAKDAGVEQVLNMSESAEIPTMDSVHAHDGVSFTALNNVKEGLYRLGLEHNAVLAIAKDHQASEDGLVHTFTLRDAKWSNGDPVTAHDFVYAWQRIFKDTGHYASMFETAKILNATEIINGDKQAEELGVKALDDKTLEVTLSGPNPLLPQNLTFPSFLPQNQEFVESQGDQYALEASNMLYNGPFVLSEWKHDQSWQYKKNPDYWDAETVKLEEINTFVVKEASTELNLYETHELDRVDLTAATVDEYQDDETFSFVDDAEIRFLRFNHTLEALGNENIRRAIDMGWDKKAHAEVILNNGSKPLYALVPKGFSTSPDGKGFRDLNGPFNQGTFEEAQAFLDKGLEEIGKETATISIMSSDDESMMKTAEYLKNQLETNLSGLKVEIKVVPFQQRLELEKAIDYGISISSWGPDYNDPMTYLGMWVTDGSANRMGYSNPEYDALIEKINEEQNPTDRYAMMLEAEKILFEDAAIGPAYQVTNAVLQRLYVKDLAYHPSGAEFSFKWAYIKK